MKTLKTLIIPVLLLLTMAACTDENKNFEPIKIEPILVAKGSNTCSSITSKNLVINDNEKWNDLLSTFDDNCIKDFKEVNIDFNTFQVVATFDEVYANLYAIDIASITEYNDNIVVKVERSLIPFGGAIGSKPFHIVKIPKNDKLILLKQFEPKILEAYLIGKGRLTGKENLKECRYSISDRLKWIEMTDNLNSIKNVTDDFIEKDIDFNNFDVIILLFDYYNTTKQDYVMEVDSVIEKETEVVVGYNARLNSSSVLPNELPFSVFKIPKTGKPIFCVKTDE